MIFVKIELVLNDYFLALLMAIANAILTTIIGSFANYSTNSINLF